MKRASRDRGAALRWRDHARRAELLQRPRPAPAPPQVSRAAEAARYRTWLNQNCVGCHSNRVKQPADDPINLESASVDDLARERGDVGACAAQARRACDAAAGQQAPERARVRGVYDVAVDLARSRLGRQGSDAGPFRRASPEPHRVRQRDSRSARARRERRRAAAERRRRLRLRQHRVGAQDVTAAARALSHRRAAREPARGRRHDGAARQHRIPDQPRVHAERLHRRPAARHARRHRHQARVSGRRRIQAVWPAGARRRRRLRRRRRQRPAAYVRDHHRWRRGRTRRRLAVSRTTKSRRAT